MGEIADASAQREEHAGRERHLHRTTASTSAAASTQSLDTCSKRAVSKACVDAAVAQFIYATGHHHLSCGSNKQVIMLRSEGLGIPLGGSRGLGSVSGRL
jgi:hypothetical protein